VFYAKALAGEGFKVNGLAPGLRATGLNASAAGSGGDPAEGGRRWRVGGSRQLEQHLREFVRPVHRHQVVGGDLPVTPGR
jgi:NAD(P)-dependent dehydrogenase (short-subunit alcohol dehydrogenase family)